ncbi:MAG: glycerol-3-phosphate dehydrogenase [Pseudomonadota bacterium]
MSGTMGGTADDTVDIFVIGGGINGCGIARDAVGRGYSVHLAEMNDLASGTSSWSTKLVHGGLRYLEHYEFRLVREALTEREVLWRMAPHIIWPLRFILPHHSGLRPAWLLRLGLFLYDHIGGRKMLPTTSVLDMRRDQAGKPLKPLFFQAFEYSDCWVDDARLVVLNAQDAAERGATVETRTQVVSARREGGRWRIMTRERDTGLQTEVFARLIVNAAGPWVDGVLGQAFGRNDAHNVRLVQGSHIVVKRKFTDPRAFIFQNADGRIIFAIPYEQNYTLIGTTDQDYEGDPAEVAITDVETDYLCSAASEYFEEPVKPDDIVWTYSGVRPLYDDGASKAQEATRDYVLKDDGAVGEPKVINIFGGKITTYRRLAESMMALVEDALGAKGKPWSDSAVLPGGDFPADQFEETVAALRADFAFLGEGHATRLVRHYGTRARSILGKSRSMDDLGTLFGADLSAREVDYLMDHEWAVTADDVLWRRSKLGLAIQDRATIDGLETYMASRKAALNMNKGGQTAAA